MSGSPRKMRAVLLTGKPETRDSVRLCYATVQTYTGNTDTLVMHG